VTLRIQYLQGKKFWALPLTLTRSYLEVLKQFFSLAGCSLWCQTQNVCC